MISQSQPSSHTEPLIGETPAHDETPPKWRIVVGRIVRVCLLIIIGCAAGIFGVVSCCYIYLTWNLPSIERLKDYSPPIVTQIYAANGELIGEFCRERRYVVPMDQIPQALKDAFISAEERDFLKHQGMDWRKILNVFVYRYTGRGMGITGQMTRRFLLTPDKRVSRKIKEAILSSRMERSLSKEYILFLYLNQIYLGSGAYGVEAASRTYFNKHVQELTVAECAMLAGLSQTPAYYSPRKNLDKAMARRAYVLKRMLDDGYISEAQYEEASREEPRIVTTDNQPPKEAADFVELVRKYVENKYGADALYREGLRVYTTLDLDLTRSAVEATDIGLRDLDKREGYRGPLKTPDCNGVTELLREKSRPYIPLVYVQKIVDRHGRVLEENDAGVL